MFGSNKVSEQILRAIEESPHGVAALDILESLKLCSDNTLKVTLARLNKNKKILRLKRGVYSTNPMKDAFFCAQKMFNGYLGFSSALYLQKLTTEMPFVITVVTQTVSKTKKIGQYEFRAVALKEKAVGFERKGDYIVSTKAKTLFDCFYFPKYSVEKEKLKEIFKTQSKEEKKEFEFYIKKFGEVKR